MSETLKNRIIEILIEGFSTQPFRDWSLEAKLKEPEITEARKKNLKHIGLLTDDILVELKKETKQAIEKVWLREEDLIDRKRGGFTIDCPEYEDGYMDALADLEKKKKQVIKSYENS